MPTRFSEPKGTTVIVVAAHLFAAISAGCIKLIAVAGAFVGIS